jgi:uncharacterized protein
MRHITPRVACESYFSQGGSVETHKSSKEGGAPLAYPSADEVNVIPWREWSDAAFVEAETADKPILLAIGAVWCHWCHVMDQTSYSDPEVIRTIAERYVPIRVDTDRRPDVNVRYNLGGWPTTAILSPQGEPLTGATYIPPPEFRALLGEVADAYRDRKGEIAAALAERSARLRERPAPEAAQLDAHTIATVRESIEALYDDEYGGFGSEPKFPMSDVLEFLVLLYARERDAHAGAMLAKTLLGMARGGMYDHVEGGFFRYSTTREWTIPHFEKMAEDHAGLLRVYARAWRLLNIVALRETLVSALGYVRTVLRDPESGLFAGSQDADEVYYALPLEQRRQRVAPFVDRTVYAGWNAGLASGLLAAARALDDDAPARDAVQALDGLDARLRNGDGLLYHYQLPGSEPQVAGLLADQAAFLRALLDAHEYTGETRFRERAAGLAERIVERFAAGDGTLLDHAHHENLGRLDIPDRPLAENSSVADSLLRLSAMTARDVYAERASSILRAFAVSSAAARLFDAPYASAVARALWGGASVAIVGAAQGSEGLREAAARLPDPFVVCATFAPEDAAARARGLRTAENGAPLAYPCRGRACGTAVIDAAALRAAFDALA